MSYDFSVELMNRSEFEKGSDPAGVWLSLPADKEALQEAMKALQITADNPQDFFINGYASEGEPQIEIPFSLIRDADIDRVNFLAARLNEMQTAEIEKLAALMHSDFHFETLDQFIDYTYNTDYFVFIPGVSSPEDLGDYYLNKSGMVQMPEEWKAGIDTARFGENAAAHEDGAFSDLGYIIKSGDEWRDMFKDRDVPEEYRIMEYPQPDREMDAPPQQEEEEKTHHAAAPIELTATAPADKMKEITDRLEAGIQDIFQSEDFKNYLNVMSKFHNYSFNNTLLIAMQKPDATLIAGYNAWKNNFGRQVQKGEKGIKVIAPSPFKVKREQPQTDPQTKKPVVGADGKPIMQEVEVTIPAYKVVSVFDVSQTEGRELPTLGVNELTGSVERYDDFFKAIEQTSPVPVAFEKIEGGAHGYYHLEDKRIAIDEGMGELQTLKTLIHEIAHAKLHDIDKNAPLSEQAERPDKRTREVQAESVAYTVCQHFGLDTSDYSFGYVATWSSGREMSELKASLETIRSAASELINDIEKNLAELSRDRGSEHGKVQEVTKNNAEENNREDTPATEKQDTTTQSFSVYQLTDRAPEEYRFRGLDEMKKEGLSIDPANYEEVYTAPLNAGATLEDIYMRLNADERPEDFRGHSLSVSDIVVLHGENGDTAHFVDPIGYKDVTRDFFHEQEAAHEAPTEQAGDAKDKPQEPESTKDITERSQEKSIAPYYPINEEAARHAQEANSFSDYVKGSATAEYRSMVDKAVEVAAKQKQRVDPQHHERIDRLVDTYARKLAENINHRNEIDARVPSILIAGASNFPVRKKEKQNAARDRNSQEFNEIQGLLDKIKSTGMGGISADDPNAVKRLQEKLEKLETAQETMKTVNAYYRKHKTLDGCPAISPARAERLKTEMSSSWRTDEKPYPSWALTNNSAEIRRVKDRIATLQRREETPFVGWEFNGGRVDANREDNRLQVFFDEKPDDKTREQLKENGFRWSPKAGAWQRQLNDNAIYAADRLDFLRPDSGQSVTELQRAARAGNTQETPQMVQEAEPGERTQDNPLAAAEMSTEQNYNMIDGQINNTPTPTVDELEKQVQAGEQISLSDLAEAIRKDKENAEAAHAREKKKAAKKPSIREQLKADREKLKPPERKAPEQAKKKTPDRGERS